MNVINFLIIISFLFSLPLYARYDPKPTPEDIRLNYVDQGQFSKCKKIEDFELVAATEEKLVKKLRKRALRLGATDLLFNEVRRAKKKSYLGVGMIIWCPAERW